MYNLLYMNCIVTNNGQMAAKLFQRSWRSASAIDSARLISSVSHWAPASQSPSLRSTQDPPTIHNTRPVSRFTLSSLVAHNNLLLQATDDHHGHSSSHHRYLSTFASPLRNLADPKRDHHNNKSIHEPYVMNLTVRDSNVIKLGTSDRQPANANDGDRVEKLGLIKRFKALYKQYWYVMLPVHVVTSTGWMVGFYYLSQRYVVCFFVNGQKDLYFNYVNFCFFISSGVDVPELLRHINISETIVAKMENSPTGHLAIAYLCYKIATPVRYMVTIGEFFYRAKKCLIKEWLL